MTILESISHSQTLLQEIANSNQSNNAEITRLTGLLASELDKINAFSLQLLDDTTTEQSTTSAKPEIQSGCYVFAGEKGFFCPHCYDNLGNKVATTRINKKLRVCPACRTSIK